MDKLTDYIVVIREAIPKEVCANIIDEYKVEDEGWGSTSVYAKNLEGVRVCDALSISSEQNLNNSTRVDIDAYIFEVVGRGMKEYMNLSSAIYLSSDEGYQILRYRENQYYKEHIDDFNNNRVVTCSIVLNDSYEGGEFSFFDGTVDYALKTGDMLLFPSNFLYPHQIKPVTKGTRYSLITWLR
jgi:hypothetical protein